MPRFSVFEGDAHVGSIKANSEKGALEQAKEMLPYARNIRVEIESDDKSNTVSVSATKKAVDAMIGVHGPRLV